MSEPNELVVVNRQAWMRANYMMKVAARYIRTPGYTDNRIVYDRAKCDGYCLADDLDAAEMVEEPPPGVPVLVNRAAPLIPLLTQVKRFLAEFRTPQGVIDIGAAMRLLVDVNTTIHLIEEFDQEPVTELPRWTERDARDLYRCVRVNNNSIPDDALDAVRDWMLANSIERRGERHGRKNEGKPGTGG